MTTVNETATMADVPCVFEPPGRTSHRHTVPQMIWGLLHMQHVREWRECVTCIWVCYHVLSWYGMLASCAILRGLIRLYRDELFIDPCGEIEMQLTCR